MSCPSIQIINGDECIGDSLPKINNNFSALSGSVCSLNTKVNTLSSSVTSLSTAKANFSAIDSSTIDLSYNSSTGVLSADFLKQWTFVAKVTADVFGTQASFGNQPAGFYELFCSNGVSYLIAPTTGPTTGFIATWKANNGVSVVDYTEQYPTSNSFDKSKPFFIKHHGGNILVQSYDTFWTNNAGPGLEIQLWRKNNILDVNQPFLN